MTKALTKENYKTIIMINQEREKGRKVKDVVVKVISSLAIS